MSKNIKLYFQEIHYSKIKPNFILNILLTIGEFFYKTVILFKNFLYEKEFLKENEVNAKVICIGNLTTGGVGKTPITIETANHLAKSKRVAIVSRGYGSKLNTKNPQIIKDYNEIKYPNGSVCGDEPYQIAKKVSKNVVVIICKDRLKACNTAIIKYNSQVIVMDDGFSNRHVKKDNTILVVDSKMKFGNNHLLPKGPLREPISEIKRVNEFCIVNKDDENIENAIEKFKEYNKKLSICKMEPKRIYNTITGGNVKVTTPDNKAIAFCAIGQPEQFFKFAKKYYDIVPLAFEDHHDYTAKDIKMLIKTADINNTNIFITTQKDETKIKKLILNHSSYSFNVLELENRIEPVI